LTSDGDFTAASVSGASVLGLAAFDGAAEAASASGACGPDGAARVAFSTDFSSFSAVKPVAGAENQRSVCGPVAASGLELVDDLGQALGRQVLVGVLKDHHHRRVDAGAEAFDLFPGQRAVGVGMELFVMDLRTADVHQRFGAAQRAGRGAADLDVGAGADRLQLELRVEGRDLEHADVGHCEHVGDMLDGGLGDPALLLLRQHEERDHRGLFAALGVFCYPGSDFSRFRLVEGEGCWLNGWLCETTDGHGAPCFCCLCCGAF
jgi:hypothetical protein